MQAELIKNNGEEDERVIKYRNSVVMRSWNRTIESSVLRQEVYSSPYISRIIKYNKNYIKLIPD
jgi:hypothetical protein